MRDFPWREDHRIERENDAAEPNESQRPSSEFIDERWIHRVRVAHVPIVPARRLIQRDHCHAIYKRHGKARHDVREPWAIEPRAKQENRGPDDCDVTAKEDVKSKCLRAVLNHGREKRLRAEAYAPAVEHDAQQANLRKSKRRDGEQAREVAQVQRQA